MDHVKKFLAKLRPEMRDKVELVIRNIYMRNLALYHVKQLHDLKHTFRIRIGHCRIIFYMDRYEVHILDVRKRDDTTYNNL